MLKILYNAASNAEVTGKITLRGSFLSISAKNTEDGLVGQDSVEAMRSYNSYIFVRAPGSKVKNFRTITGSDYKFLDMNRLGVAIKMDYTDMIQLYSKGDVIQVDTGMVCGTERDIIIRVFEGMKGSFEVDADMDYEVGEFNSKTLPQETHPRMTLWDSYSVDSVSSHPIRGQIPVQEPQEIQQAAPEQKQDMSKYREQKQSGY